MMDRFDAAADQTPGRGGESLVYRNMESVNFSREIVERSADWTTVMPMEGVHWSDWTGRAHLGDPGQDRRSSPSGAAVAPATGQLCCDGAAPPGDLEPSRTDVAAPFVNNLLSIG